MTKVATFWKWFKANQARAAEIDEGHHAVLNELIVQLQRIHEGLFAEVGTNFYPNELIITAAGDLKLFPLVDSIIKEAPEMEAWKIIALKPPQGFAFTGVYNGISYNPARMWFLPLKNPNSPSDLGLQIGVPPAKVAEKWAVLTLLETGLGEREFAETISMVRIDELPDAPKAQGYIELTDLPRFLEWRKRQIK